MREIRVLSEGYEQYKITIPKAIVHRLFRRGVDGRYYARMNIEDDAIKLSPVMTYLEKSSEEQHLDPLAELDRLHQLEEGDDASRA